MCDRKKTLIANYHRILVWKSWVKVRDEVGEKWMEVVLLRKRKG